MADELQYDGTKGAGTVLCMLCQGAPRWNGSAVVARSSILDANWTTGMVTCTEELTADGTPTGHFVGDVPAGMTDDKDIDAYYFESATPAPGDPIDGHQFIPWNGSSVVRLNSVSLAASGADAVLIESGITPSAALVNDSRTQLTAINFRQAISVFAAALAGRISGVDSNSPVCKAAGKATNRISATTDATGRTAVNLQVPD